MKIEELFVKPVDRPIDGVIKADDDRNLQIELEEYVVTRDVLKGLGDFTERYLHETTANGVWISGFFGSGKSHLLKILSLVLDGRPLASGIRPSDLVLPKIDDEIVQASLRKAAGIPSQSILFNIDQKFDGIGGDHGAPILEVFVKVLNELQGYFGKQGYIARFEHDLDIRGDYGPFKETYQRLNGSTWERDREAIATARKAAFARAYAAHFAVSEDEAARVMRQVREDYRVSIESFAKLAKEYIDKQPAGFRLNFFVDEAGQFIGQNSKLMLNLQTVAETLGTVCNGRSWVFVTSQADLEGVLGAFKGMEAQDITKIMGRFKTQLTLASADVREVIQRRLLAKKEPEPPILTAIYDRERDNFQTLYRFGDKSIQFNGWRGSDEFCGFYPFHPHQFDLFQRAIQQLSAHGVFTGKYLSVGERSMLAVFQEVAKGVRHQEIGRLATFDLMYDGIAPSIRPDAQTAMKLAERQLGEGLPLRILKAMFLLKWVTEFKATPRNVAILLIDQSNPNIREHERAVREALELLEGQSYLQRTGDIFEFLTDVEKDVEVEIKNTDIEETQVSDLLCKVLFSDVLREAKIRYDGNGQDYPYARKLDDHVIGRDADIAVNIITIEHPNHRESNVLAMQGFGKAELLVVLPAETRLNDMARLYLKTQKYVQMRSGEGDLNRKAVLELRTQQNSARRNEMQVLATEYLTKAPLYLNGKCLDTVGEGDPRGRFAKACKEVIGFGYPNLRMLKGAYDEVALSKSLQDPNDLLVGIEVVSEAEQEVLTYVARNQGNGERTAVDEIVRVFAKRPFGWYPLAVLTQVARLFRMGKVELRGPDLLDARSAFERMKNSRAHSGVRVRLQEVFDTAKVEALKRFHQSFFDRASSGTDARSVGQCTAEAFAAEARDLGLLIDQVARYTFLAPLVPVATRLSALADKEHVYLISQLGEYEDELLTAKEDLLDPVKAFMHGAQRVAYDEAITFLNVEEANFAELPAGEVQPLRDLAASPHPFRGNFVPSAKTAVTRLKAVLSGLVSAERATAGAIITEHEDRLKRMDEFAALDAGDQEEVLAASVAARAAIDAARFASGIRDRLQRFVTREYPEQLALVDRLAASPPPEPPVEPGATPLRPNPPVGPILTPPQPSPPVGPVLTPPQPSPPVGPVPTPPPRPPAVKYTTAASLRPKCKLPYIATEADLDEWLEALREAALAELTTGRRISL